MPAQSQFFICALGTPGRSHWWVSFFGGGGLLLCFETIQKIPFLLKPLPTVAPTGCSHHCILVVDCGLGAGSVSLQRPWAAPGASGLACPRRQDRRTRDLGLEGVGGTQPRPHQLI